jgi:hypothetical protein
VRKPSLQAHRRQARYASGINKGTRVYVLDDPDGNTFCMKSASLIEDPSQIYDRLKDLGSRLKLAPGWKFPTVVLEKDLVLTG